MSTVAIIDYGLCNLDSIARAVEKCGGNPTVTSNPKKLSTAGHVILPGVGAFDKAMHNLAKLNLDDAIKEECEKRQVPILGICLGMQLLADSSTENKKTSGLGIISADVIRLTPARTTERVPHIGWNEVIANNDTPLFHGIDSGKDFYFVHSYHVSCNPENVSATTPYCGGFVSAIESHNVFGVQFHPEKSQRVGFALLKNFLELG
jgi:glutamine amidotransferase